MKLHLQHLRLTHLELNRTLGFKAASFERNYEQLKPTTNKRVQVNKSAHEVLGKFGLCGKYTEDYYCDCCDFTLRPMSLWGRGFGPVNADVDFLVFSLCCGRSLFRITLNVLNIFVDLQTERCFCKMLYSLWRPFAQVFSVPYLNI